MKKGTWWIFLPSTLTLSSHVNKLIWNLGSVMMFDHSFQSNISFWLHPFADFNSWSLSIWRYWRFLNSYQRKRLGVICSTYPRATMEKDQSPEFQLLYMLPYELNSSVFNCHKIWSQYQAFFIASHVAFGIRFALKG